MELKKVLCYLSESKILMKLPLGFLIFLAALCCLTEGQLIQETGDEETCSNDTAVVFSCTNRNYAYVIWNIYPTMESPFSLSNTRAEGTLVNHTISGSPVIFYVAMNTGSSITVTMTVLRPLLLNQTRISCQGDTLWLNVSIKDKNSVPEQIFLTPDQLNNEVSNFTITWSQPQQDVTYFTINIDPVPLHKPSGLLNSSTAVEICLSNNVEYNITMSFNICTEWINKTFLFGKCPLLWNSSVLSVIRYNLDSSGKVSAFVSLASSDVSQTHLIEFGNDGQWTTDVCRSINIKTTEEENEVEFMTVTEITKFICD